MGSPSPSVMQVSLHKAFGLEVVDEEFVSFLAGCVALGRVAISLKRHPQLNISIGIGHYGEAEEEKEVIRRYFPSHRQYDVPTLVTLDITVDGVQTPETLPRLTEIQPYTKDELALDHYIASLVPILKAATDKFYWGYGKFRRHEKIDTPATWEEIAYEQKVLQPPSLRELGTYLFYEVKDSEGACARGSISQARGLTTVLLSEPQASLVKTLMEEDPPLPELLFTDALVYFYEERYRETYLITPAGK